jgi:S1/P1 Nuclease
MPISGLKSRRHGRLSGGAVAESLVVGCMMTSLLSMMLVPASGWGTIGHEVVANLAWHRLSNHTRQAIQDILGNDDENGTEVAGSPLASVADWADRVRTKNNELWCFGGMMPVK